MNYSGHRSIPSDGCNSLNFTNAAEMSFTLHWLLAEAKCLRKFLYEVTLACLFAQCKY